MIPDFEENGNLPKGIYKAAFYEVKDAFGTASARRKWLIGILQKIIELAKSTGRLERVIIWGSFVSNKEFPNDIDLLFIMKENFIVEDVAPEVKSVFDYVKGRLVFNADIFWTKSSIGEETINLWLETYQMTLNFEPRGIIEVIINDQE